MPSGESAAHDQPGMHDGGDTRGALGNGDGLIVQGLAREELLIEIDLKLTPSAAAAKEISWEQVQVDDCFTGPNGVVSGSTLGPAWPELRPRFRDRSPSAVPGRR